MDAETLFCPLCQQIVLTEQPPCPDGHGAGCPDRACTVCGAALCLDGRIRPLHSDRRQRTHRTAA